nr:LPTK44=cytoplasmic tyrosine protein kinase/Src28C homolog [Hirudo medicinalis=leeches, Annelida, embryonic, Peptide, 53 aa] [Hirudo medicinalis]
NCLVGEKQSIKICDFGLSRRVIDDEYNSSSDFYFSIRWSSPESLTLKKFSSKS